MSHEELSSNESTTAITPGRAPSPTSDAVPGNRGCGRARRWCFTINNYSDADITALRSLFDTGKIKFLIVGRETGASGTPHLQGYAEFSTPARFNAARSAISSRCHIEPARGDSSSNVAYCSKDGDVVLQLGESGQSRQADAGRESAFKRQCRDVFDELKSTGDLGAVAREHPDLFLRYSQGLRSATILLRDPGPIRPKPVVYWLWGKTGVGKSRAVAQKWPDAYWKMMNKWWDGYTWQDVVVLDDMRGTSFDFAFLLTLFEQNPVRVECKGGSMNFNSKIIVVTTPHLPHMTFLAHDDEDMEQIARRIKLIEVKLDVPIDWSE